MIARVAVAALLLTGCLRSDVVDCDGTLCPAGDTCGTYPHVCIDPAEVCTGTGACMVLGSIGTCVDGLCIIPSCGNGIVDPGEVCDDGTSLDVDTCRSDCQSDLTCGNGIADFEVGEACDCGSDPANLPPGCNAPNQASGGLCRTDCQLHCGDGVLDPDELCDGPPPIEHSCVSLGFDRGRLGCSAACTLDLLQCGRLGWPADPSLLLGFAGDVWIDGHTTVVGEAGVDVNNSDGTGWTHVALGATIYAVWGASPTDVFAAGEGGTIYHYDGTAWSPTAIESLDFTFFFLVGTGGSDVYASGAGNTVDRTYHFDGTAWTPIAALPGNLSPWVASASDVWMLRNDCSLWRGAGTTWTAQAAFVPGGTYCEGIWGSAADDVYVGTSLGVVHFDGAWSTVDPQIGYALTGRDATDVIAAGGALRHWDGASWQTEDTGATAPFIAVASDGASLVGLADGFRHYAGAAWSDTSLPDGVTLGRGPLESGFTASSVAILDGGVVTTLPAPPLLVYDVWAEAPDEVYAIGRASTGPLGAVARWAGTQWVDLAPPIQLSFESGWHDAGGALFVGGDHTIARYDNGTWTHWDVPVDFHALWGTSPSDVYAVGDQGVVVHFDGSQWVQESAVVNQPLRDVWGTAADDVFAVGELGEIVHRDGTSWTRAPSGTTHDLLGVWGTGGHDVFAVGRTATVLHYDGVAWSPVRADVADDLYAVRGATGAAIDVAGASVRRLLRDNGWACEVTNSCAP